MNFSIITPSWHQDLARCEVLCESMDKFVNGNYEHIIVTEERDFPLFKHLQSGNRRLITRESIIPNHRFDSGILPNGWIMQQLIKLSSSDYLESDVYIFADSELIFLRPFSLEFYIKNGKVDLFSEPAKDFDGPESKLKRSAPRILRYEFKREGNQFVMPLTSWRRDILIELRQYIEQAWQTDNWIPILSSQEALSEYELYGKFVDDILRDSHRHFRNADKSRCYCRWTGTFPNAKALDNFFFSIPSTVRSVLIQSSIGIEAKDYIKNVRKLWENSNAIVD